jgi:hypothetical protein
MQQHDAVVGHPVVGLLEVVVVLVEAEVLEGTDRNNPVDLPLKLLPGL